MVTTRNLVGFFLCLSFAGLWSAFLSIGLAPEYYYGFGLPVVLTALGLWLAIKAVLDVRTRKWRYVFRPTWARIVEALALALITPILWISLMPLTFLFILPVAVEALWSGRVITFLIGVWAWLFMGLLYYGVLCVFKTRWPGKENAWSRRVMTVVFVICASTFSMTFYGWEPFTL